MNSQQFKQRSFTETLTLLCQARAGQMMRAGKVNQSAIARLAGTKQGNISRWFSGVAKPNDENINLLAKAFKITPAQMRGESPINALDGYIQPSPEDEPFITEYASLPEEEKNAVRDFVRYRKYLSQGKPE